MALDHNLALIWMAFSVSVPQVSESVLLLWHILDCMLAGPVQTSLSMLYSQMSLLATDEKNTQILIRFRYLGLEKLQTFMQKFEFM